MRIRYEIEIEHREGKFCAGIAIQEALDEDMPAGGQEIQVEDSLYEVTDCSEVPDPEPLITVTLQVEVAFTHELDQSENLDRLFSEAIAMGFLKLYARRGVDFTGVGFADVEDGQHVAGVRFELLRVGAPLTAPQ